MTDKDMKTPAESQGTPGTVTSEDGTPVVPQIDNSTVDNAAESDDDASAKRAGDERPTLNAMYDHLRHSTDPDELREFAVRPLPDRSNAAAFSRATALLEAVAGNPSTPLDARIALADLEFPNILVKLSDDPEPAVRRAVAANGHCKNWLVGRLTKDDDATVRETALHNRQTSWKMLMEGAEDARTSADTLEYLSRKGTEEDFTGPTILAAMVRRGVAGNPNAAADTVTRLANDPVPDVSDAAQKRLAEEN